MDATALIVGVGPGLSASFARRCASGGMAVALAARNPAKLEGLGREIGARVYPCDASEPADVDRLFESVAAELPPLDLALYNPSARVRGPVAEIDRERVRQVLLISCYGGFLVGQRAAQAMLARGRGAIFFTGASASVKGYPQSASFAMGKFGLRGLAQSMARELAPQNVHVAHFVIDGGIGRTEGRDSTLDPDAIAETYWHVYRQPRSAWTWEIELRPWVETF